MSGAVVLVAAVGAARGSRAVAAALACAGPDPDRAGLLIDIGSGNARPTLVASTAARELEERLAVHLPDCPAASRGRFCRLAVDDEVGCFEAVRAALPLVRDSLAVIHLSPGLFQAALATDGVETDLALLRADLASDRALTGLAVRAVREHGLPVHVVKRPLPWLSARGALLGALSADALRGLPAQIRTKISVEHACYAEPDDEETDPTGTAQQQRRGHARPRWRRALHRDPERQARR